MMYAVAVVVFATVVSIVTADMSGLCASDPFLGTVPTNPDDPQATRVLVDGDNVACLDGTLPAYYILKGSGSGAAKFYIHHQGGGWCESEEDCFERSSTQLGSSHDYPPSAGLGSGYFSTDPTQNPMMYNWNLVFLRYCDGGSFSGRNMSTTTYNGRALHFKGNFNLEAIQQDLINKHDLMHASDVVVSGCSAGGLATFLHVDAWQALFDLSKTKVRGMPDSGFFLDEQFIAPQPASGRHLTTIPGNYHDGLQWVFNAMNSTDGVNSDCIRAHEATRDTYLCIFAEHTSPHIKTPIFPLQSEYDAWQSEHVIPDKSLIPGLGVNITKLLTANLLNSKVQPDHGVFLDSCYHHCGDFWDKISIDGDLQHQAFQAWYDDPHTKKVWMQAKPYPCDACCSPP